MNGDADFDGRLDVGETWRFTATRIAREGSQVHTAAARGLYADTAGHERIAAGDDEAGYVGNTGLLVASAAPQLLDEAISSIAEDLQQLKPPRQ
jgi:hypothetical protein